MNANLLTIQFINNSIRNNKIIKQTSSGLCPDVPVHRWNNYCTPLFTSLCLAVAKFLVLVYRYTRTEPSSGK